MTRGFAFAHASGEDWRACARRCAEAIGRPAGGLGFVYLTDALATHAEAIVALLRESTGVADWVGTVGIGVIATGTEYVDEPAMVAMVADFAPGQYGVFSGRARPDLAAAPHFAIVHADPATPDVAGLISDMSTKVASGFLVGGLTSSRTRSLQVANDVVSGGLSGVLLSDAVGVSTRLTQGCTPMRDRADPERVPSYRVTACEANVIETLDGRPALDVFREAVGEVLARDLRRAAAYVLVGLRIRGSGHDDRSAFGDYLARHLVGFDPRDGRIAIGDMIEQGDEIIFCRRDGESAREDLQRMLGELRATLPGPPRGALYYSCVGRGEHMFGARGAELGLVREALGDVPLAGFFCNGEISHDRLYGYTGVLTLFH